ncbi:LOB domain-containing protein [Artemisia annua]|uniref:LOB domain-containing protein n=1 Tax=Artemisia annua TaxID=35608 RepID=A0A2U1KQL8_ARTAN|nr:LOB domain-containing protein [Artemisia annua]
MSSSSNSPCAACKFLRRKCTQECVFAPYFPPDQPAKFANVHKVFGASNVAKILNELSAAHREDAVNSLAYEAEARLRDPVYGCVGLISVLQHRLKQVQVDLHSAKQELATYIGPSAMMPNLTQAFMQQYVNMQPMLGQMGGIGPVGAMGPGTPSNMQPILGLQGPRDAQQQQQLYEAQQQQLLDAAREQEMFRNFEQQQLQQLQQQQQSQHHQQIDLMRYNRGFDVTGPSGQQVNPSGFAHLTGPSNMVPSLALGAGSYDNAMYQIQHEPQPQEDHSEPHLQQFIPQQLLVQQQVQQPQPEPQQQPQMQPQEHNGEGSEEGRSAAAQLVRLSDNDQN